MFTFFTCNRPPDFWIIFAMNITSLGRTVSSLQLLSTCSSTSEKRATLDMGRMMVSCDLHFVNKNSFPCFLDLVRDDLCLSVELFLFISSETELSHYVTIDIVCYLSSESCWYPSNLDSEKRKVVKGYLLVFPRLKFLCLVLRDCSLITMSGEE